MRNSRVDVWETSEEVYSATQIESILDKLEVEVVNDTFTHFMAYCPFHDNTDDAAFVIDKTKGLWICFNPSCGVSGNLEDLVRKIKKCNPFKAQMLILKSKSDDKVQYTRKAVTPVEFREFEQSKLDELYRNFKGSPGQTYMYGRGLTDESLEYFRVGYSPEREYPRHRPEMVIVPMHDVKGMPIGLIGRSIKGKDFKNSTGLPKRLTTWNIHRAKREGETVIIVEASFDAMRVHQAGYRNVIALLGGHLSQAHVDQIDRHFSSVVIMTDFEQGDDMIVHKSCRKCDGECRGHRPGRDLGRSIAKQLSNKKVRWASYDDSCIYPNGAKDVGQMTDDEIRQCLKNSVSNFEYNRWNIEGIGLRLHPDRGIIDT